MKAIPWFLTQTFAYLLAVLLAGTLMFLHGEALISWLLLKLYRYFIEEAR